jgi:tryptophan synthase alpha chain
MNRIDKTFGELARKGEKALIPFLVAGDPDLGTTRELIHAVEESGADMLEIGVPFSDPTSDGPVIQHSAEIALQAGSSLPRVLEMVADVRTTSQMPIILYGYYNPIFRYGVERFAADAAAAGVDAVLVVDLPPEEVDELLPYLRANGIHFVFLLAPTSNAARVHKVLRKASGFLYYVSVTGVTGAAAMQPASVRPAIDALRSQTDLPIGVGFGISTPDQAAAVAEFADAAVVGTAIMRVIDAHRGTDRVVPEVAAFVRSLKEGIRTARRA